MYVGLSVEVLDGFVVVDADGDDLSAGGEHEAASRLYPRGRLWTGLEQVVLVVDYDLQSVGALL